MTSDPSKRAQTFDLKTGTTDPREVSDYYDDWASTYDETLKFWNYQAPSVAAEKLSRHLEDGSDVLDVGCGTGLFGQALAHHGAFRMVGLDISAQSLNHARTSGLYDQLIKHDLQKLPLPLGENSMNAAASIGVLTYIESAGDMLRDLCRCVCPGGVITFTQRTDRWAELDFDKTVKSIAEEGRWSVLEISQPQDYLPGNEDFGKDIKIIYTVCKVT